jgi:thioredoxin reductase
VVGLDRQPFPPGSYDVVVVGSGPGGLQTSYFLARLGIRHAVLSADREPGGMFLKWPIFERLLSWSKLDAPVGRDTREYEWYDHNSLIADDPENRALVPAVMSRESVVPTRAEMAAGLAAFAARTSIRVRYGTRWEATRREGDALVLETSDGEYRCRAAVFAVGATDPWRSPIPGIEHVPHYADTREPDAYRGRDVFVIGKRNSAFEVADGLLPWARQIVLASPRPAQAAVLAHATVRARYLQPLEDYAVGGGTLVVDAAIERIERHPDGRFLIRAAGTTQPGSLEFTADAVIAATGFSTPMRDLPALGVATVAEGRLPALTPYWESISAPGVFFAGNVSQGAPGLRKHGYASSSAAVHGFRYNARILARYLAERRLGIPLDLRPLRSDEVVPLLAGDLARRPELWAQKGYLARAVTLGDGYADAGIVPLAAFVDETGPDAVAVAVEADARGRLFPAVYLRRSGRAREIALDPHPLQLFDGPTYRRDLSTLLGLRSRTHDPPRARPVFTQR